MSASIRRLPDNVVHGIKASATLSCLNDAVCGLLKNALDAGASRVDIYLDYSRGNCTVEDNGDGIATAEFREDGGLGKPHHTSRPTRNLQVHGNRGDFIASAATLSLLSITSHQAQQVSHNSITYHHGRVIARDVPARLDQRFMRYRHGTRVVVRNLFGSMPVRVKHRSLTFSHKSEGEKELRHLVRQIVALLLAWPQEIALTLKETKAQRELRFRSPGRKESISVCASRLLVQSNLVDMLSATDLVPVSAATDNISIEGCISTVPVASRHCQMISLGVHPIHNDYGSNILYQEVNTMFQNSSFGIIDRTTEQSSNTQGAPKLRKGVEKWPVFYFHLSMEGPSLKLGVADTMNDSSSEATEVLQLLQIICYSFLRKHHFRPLKLGSITRNARPPGASTRKVQGAESQTTKPPDPFNDWPRTKLSVSSAVGKPLAAAGTYELPILSHKQYGSNNDNETTPQGAFDRMASSNGDNNHSALKAKPLRVVANFPTPEPSAWLQRIIDTWQNPIFETAEQLVPRLGTQMMPADNPVPLRHTNNCQGGTAQYESGTVVMNSRITRKALGDAEIIAQVDRKFILIKVALNDTESGPSTGLFMVDQHAADERRRLEQLMKDYFGASQTALVEPLDQPIMIELSQREAESLRQRRPYFAAWGIVYDIAGSHSHHGVKLHDVSYKATVSSLPPSIVERCRTEPRLLPDMLRHEAWSDSTAFFPSVQKTPNEDGPNQLPSFHGCPKGIVELLHSRSCRSAIMFNDELTKAECETLVNRLSQCSFPFQCAHGRPSMAPLVNLGIGDRIGGWFEDRHDAASIEKWKTWVDD